MSVDQNTAESAVLTDADDSPGDNRFDELDMDAKSSPASLDDWTPFLWRFSKTQWLLPSSSMKFHHLNPTMRRPVTFLTVQKSIEINKISAT